MGTRRTPTPVTIALWSIVLVGLAAAQFPGILFYHDVVEPRIFGMPFIYGFNALIWIILCVVLYIAYRVRWGRPSPDDLDDEFPDDLGRGTHEEPGHEPARTLGHQNRGGE
ncbi:MAG TPA: DUF3311 domain-containing protein [Candidatus Nesterenkonia stercoripullorum]|uniref:DUF3311 domain-containing protein n=1 Tax=Candidatus Nesterenkonia stercoripullorum TaxID=2838701 RepID=A0A9D1S1B4_9MICC|nr:DUF3311 domain-containing protein [Candidatus Nesterenkonia stercoripullorum]